MARGVIHYNGDLIHAYYSPFFGASAPGQANTTGHVRTGDVYPNGSYVDFDYKAINEKGDVWYRVAGQPHRWLYGPHISFNSTGTYIEDPTARGTAAIKPNQQKYVMRKGKIVPAPAQTKYVSARNKRTKKYVNKTYITTYHGKKIKQKHVVKNKAYSRKKKETVKTTIKRGVYKIKGQIQYDGSTYYKTGNNVYVKSSSVDWKNRMSYKPKTIDQATKGKWVDGKIEMYSQPAFNTAMNWAIPNGTSFATGATAKGDGEDWTQVTYAGKTGWVLTKYLKNKSDEDFDPYNPDDLESSDDTTPNYNVDVSDLTVKLPEVTLYADSAYGEEAPRVLAVDLSSYFSHDYQDESGFDNATGEYHVTQADIDQLRQLAQAYMREHRFGEPNVSLTLTAEQISDYQLDNIGLYDRVTVNFDQLGINETAEVNSTTWDAMAHRYTEMTIGELPVTYEHQLLQQAKEQTTATVRGATRRTQGWLNRFEDMMNSEGSDRRAKEDSMMKDLGMIQNDITWKDDKGKEHKLKDVYLESRKDFEDHFQQLDDDASDIKSWIDAPGDGVIQALPNWQAPQQFKARASNNADMIFDANGLEFVDRASPSQKLLGGFDSRGHLYADSIEGVHVKAMDIDAMEMHGHLISSDPGKNMKIYIGTKNPGSTLDPWKSGRVIWAVSDNYSSMVSSGQIATTSGSSTTRIHPSAITVGDDMNEVLTQENFAAHAYRRIKSWVKLWIADWITINGKKHTIWKGIDKGAYMGKLRDLSGQGKNDYSYTPGSNDDYGKDEGAEGDGEDLGQFATPSDIQVNSQNLWNAINGIQTEIKNTPEHPISWGDVESGLTHTSSSDKSKMLTYTEARNLGLPTGVQAGTVTVGTDGIPYTYMEYTPTGNMHWFRP